MEIQELMLEVDSSSNLVKVASSDMSEVLKYFSALGGIITVSSISWNNYYENWILHGLENLMACIWAANIFCCLLWIHNILLQMQDFRTLALQTSVEIKSVTSNYEKLKLGFEHRVSDLEGEKVIVYL